METNLMYRIIGIAVGLLLVAVLIPVALQTLATANVTDVDPTVIVVLQVVLPILAILAIAIYFIPKM